MASLSRRDLLLAGIAGSTGIVSCHSSGSRPFTIQTDQDVPISDLAVDRERLLLDFGWRFHLGHAYDARRDFGLGANTQTFAKSGNFVKPAEPAFDDSDWTALDLPHDWALDLPFVNDPSLTYHGFKPLGRAYPDTSIGWYRRVFELPKGDFAKRIWLDFDGVFRNALVVLNGQYVGQNMGGYVPFSFDVSDFVNVGGTNVLVVRVDATLNEGWFYEGAGIYRHVWLRKVNPVYVRQDGIVVRTELNPDATGAANVLISVEVGNDHDKPVACSVGTTLFDKNGKAVARGKSLLAAIPAWGEAHLETRTVVGEPHLWSVETPDLYRAVVTVENGGTVTDLVSASFGIRTIRFDANQGFFLNNRPVKIKGVCNHQDHAGVGTALPDRLQVYRLEKLKEMGANGFRASHNPPAPEVLDACDRLGLLVMDETRMMSSNPEGLSQLERLIRRDRNHPSVVIWSLGNEEPEQGTARGARMVSTMKRVLRQLDATRPITVAMNAGWGSGVSGVVDVQGFNYFPQYIDDFHARFPKQPTIGTETASALSTRGIYTNDKASGYVSAYGLNKPNWGNTAEEWWKPFDRKPFLAGGYLWTGFDYRGEPTPYEWPCISSHFGVMDTCGFPKDDFYYYQAWWSGKPVLHLFPHWNWTGKEGQEIEVWCHTNMESAELLLNGVSLGLKKVERDTHVSWNVRYQPGTIVARGFSKQKLVLTDKRETTETGTRIKLRADRSTIAADREDVTIVSAEVLDSVGRLVPTARNQIVFAIKGPGRVLGVGNGDPTSHEPDRASRRAAFGGLCMALVQSTREPGPIEMSASSPGLGTGFLTIESKALAARPSL